MNEVIDLAFIAAKVAAMRDEKARMIVGGASLVYNVSQIARFKAMIVEFSQLCNYIVCVARFRGYCTQEEYNIVIECQQHFVKYDHTSLIPAFALALAYLNDPFGGRWHAAQSVFVPLPLLW